MIYYDEYFIAFNVSEIRSTNLNKQLLEELIKGNMLLVLKSENRFHSRYCSEDNIDLYTVKFINISNDYSYSIITVNDEDLKYKEVDIRINRKVIEIYRD